MRRRTKVARKRETDRKTIRTRIMRKRKTKIRMDFRGVRVGERGDVGNGDEEKHNKEEDEGREKEVDGE